MKGLKEFKQEAGISLWKISQDTGVTYPQLNQIERFKLGLTQAVAKRIAASLGVDPEELVASHMAAEIENARSQLGKRKVAPRKRPLDFDRWHRVNRTLLSLAKTYQRSPHLVETALRLAELMNEAYESQAT